MSRTRKSESSAASVLEVVQLDLVPALESVQPAPCCADCHQRFRDLHDPGSLHWKGWRCKGIASDLGYISLYEHQHGRPLPSSAVIYAGFEHPARDFWQGLCRDMLHMDVPPGRPAGPNWSPTPAERAFWREKLAEFVTFWPEAAAALA